MTERMTAAELQRQHAHASGVQPESLILRQCRDYLRATGWYVLRIQQGPLCEKGISDLICIRKGRVVFAEVKTAKGRLSIYQETFAGLIAHYGGEYVVLRCYEDAVAMSEGAAA